MDYFLCENYSFKKIYKFFAAYMYIYTYRRSCNNYAFMYARVYCTTNVCVGGLYYNNRIKCVRLYIIIIFILKEEIPNNKKKSCRKKKLRYVIYENVLFFFYDFMV